MRTNGVIFTNSHVIDHADEIVVTLPDGRELPAKRVGSDRGTDVAVIKVQVQNLTALPIGDSDGLEVGNFVLAIGNPYQIGQTVTPGIISGLHRRNVGIAEYEDLIQTDAAIYPGDSGGALVNLDGKLIGINTAFIRTTTTNPGMGFVIPINMVRLIADQLLNTTKSTAAGLGLLLMIPPLALDPVTGPVIAKVEQGSCTGAAGPKAGDVVSELAKISVRDTSDLPTRMALLWVGDVANLTVVRNGKPMTIHTTVSD
jgi:serine protease DegQ